MANQYTARVTATLVSGSLQKAIEAQAKSAKINLQNVHVNASSVISEIQKALNNHNFKINVNGLQQQGQQAGQQFVAGVNSQLKNIGVGVGGIKNMQNMLQQWGLNPADINKVTNHLSHMSVAITKIKTSLGSNGNIKMTITGVDELGRVVTQVKEFDRVSGQISNAGRTITQTFGNVTKAAKETSTQTKKCNDELTKIKSNTLDNKIQSWMNKNAEAGKKFETELRNIQQQLRATPADDNNLKLLSAQFENIKAKAQSAGLTVKGFHDAFVNIGSATKNFMLQMVGLGSAYQIGMKLINTVKQGVTTVVDLDTALIDLRKTAKMSGSELEQFYRDANTEAKNLGVTTKEIIEQAAAWSRLGYSTAEEVKTMSRLSSQFAQISPGMSTTESQEALVSTMKAFGIETNDVLDGIMSKINIVGNSFAISNKDIADALKVSSSSMSAANNTFEETIALITAGTEITQDASRVGNGLRTISMRIRGLNEETGEFDETLGNVKNDISELTHGLVSIMEDDNTYKSTYDILDRIAQIWDQLTDKEQAGLMEKLFGKNRAQIGVAILSNFEAARDAIDKMAVSAGNADAEMSIIMDSLDYKLNRLKETGTGIWQNLLDRGEVGGIVDALTGLLSVIEKITGALGGLGTVLATGGIIGAIAFFTNPSAMLTITTIFYGIVSALPAIAGVAAAVAAITIGFKAWKEAHPTLQDLQNDADKAQQEFNSMETKVKEVHDRIEELNELKANGTITEAQERELDNLQSQVEMYEQQLELLRYINDEKQKAVVQKTNEEVTGFFNTQQNKVVAVGLEGEEYYERATTGYGGLLNKIEDYKNTSQKIADLTQQIAEFRESGDEKSLKRAEKLNKQLTEAREQSVSQLEDILGVQKELMEYRETLIGKEDEDSIKNLQLIDEAIAMIAKEAKQANPTIKTFEENFKRLPEEIQKAFKGLNVDELTEEQLDAVIKWMDECGYSIDDLKAHLEDLNNTASASFTQTVQKNIGDLTSFRDELASTSQALADYNAAMEGGEKGDAFKSMQEIYKGALEDIQAGRIDSNRMHAAAQLFFSPDQLASWNYDLEEIGRQMQSSWMKTLFDPNGESVQSAGQRLMSAIKDNAARFDGVAGVIDRGNGQIDFWYKNIEELANAMNMSTDAAQAFLDEWNNYGVNVMQSSQDLAELIAKFQDLKQNTDSEKEAVKQLVNEMQANGSDVFEITAVLESLKESGAVTASVSELSDIIKETTQSVEELDQKDAKPEIKAQDRASSVIAAVEQKLSNLNGRTATTYINTVERSSGVKTSTTSSVSGSYSKAGSTSSNKALAKATYKARASGGRGGGITLLNEDGAELVSERGVAFIANGGEPGFVNLSKDAIVFNAEQTRKIFASSVGSAVSYALASGNADNSLLSRFIGGLRTPAKRQAEGLTAKTSPVVSKAITSYTTKKKCPRCGSGVDESKSTCPYCGYNFTAGGYSTTMVKANVTSVNNGTGKVTTSTISTSGNGNGYNVISDLAARINASVSNNSSTLYNGTVNYPRSYQSGTLYSGGTSYGGSDVGGYTGSSGGDSVGSSNYQSQSDPEKVDWIAVAINRIQRVIADLQKVATSGFKKLSARLNASREEINEVTHEIDIMTKGYERYIQEANSVGLSEDLAAKVREGTIDINAYDESTRKLISEYQEW